MSSYACRICSSAQAETVLDYGRVALADSFLSDLDHVSDEPRFPLTLVICLKCKHLQIREVLDPSLLFSNYVWETGIPASIGPYCRSFADQVIERTAAAAGGRVLEIASNDGTMLAEFKSRGFNVLGVDPAQNIAKKADARGIPTVADFFGLRVARTVSASKGSFNLILARNVLAHVADLHGLMDGIKLLLETDGTAVIEVPHLLTLFNELQYDQVFHEHIGYHSLDSIQTLCDMHALQVVDVDTAWVHGGSLRVYMQHKERSTAATSAVTRVLTQEREAGLFDPAKWKIFAGRVGQQKVLLREELQKIVASGGVVAGYGASGKGQSMIQYCELGPTLISYVVDKSTMKIGKWTPGSHIPISSPQRLQEEPPTVLLLFAWNFADEIVKQVSALKLSTVRFLHPIPAPHYI